MINYRTFIQLYNEALEYNDFEYYMSERAWQEWMNIYKDKPDKIVEILKTTYSYAKKTIEEIRETLDYSRAKFSRVYNIPIRTLENWDAKQNLTEYTETLIKYTLFLEELSNNEEDIEEQD